MFSQSQNTAELLCFLLAKYNKKTSFLQMQKCKWEWKLIFSTMSKHNSYMKDKINPPFFHFLWCHNVTRINHTNVCTELHISNSVNDSERHGLPVWLSLWFLWADEGRRQKGYCECVSPSSPPTGSRQWSHIAMWVWLSYTYKLISG